MADAVFMLLLFSLPSLAYANLRARQGGSWAEGLARVGLRPSRPIDYARALAVAVGLVLLTVAAVNLVPVELLRDPRATPLRGGPLGPAVIPILAVSVLAEEMLFRGFGCALLFERFGFRTGNLIQTGLFVAAHLVVVAVGAALWPLLVVDAVTGWSLGWLRKQSGSLVPGFLVRVVLGLTLVAAYGG